MSIFRFVMKLNEQLYILVYCKHRYIPLSFILSAQSRHHVDTHANYKRLMLDETIKKNLTQIINNPFNFEFYHLRLVIKFRWLCT